MVEVIDAEGNITMDWLPSAAPMNATIDAVFKEANVGVLGGPSSGFSWSAASTAQRCLRAYYRRYVRHDQGEPDVNLEIGAAFHAFLALWNLGAIRSDLPFEPIGLRDALLARNVDAVALAEAWRVFEAYSSIYENDYLEPLAVELEASTPEGFSCRFDMIARVRSPQSDAPSGVYAVESKTSWQITANSANEWQNDGEVIGQQMIYREAGLSKKYGPLAGSIIDIISKTRVPKAMRVTIPIRRKIIRAHHSDLDYWRALVNLHRATGVWPRSRQSCLGRFAKPCAYYDECAQS